ncbi:putative EF-hand domain pair protein CML [Helianthus anomalus]
MQEHEIKMVMGNLGIFNMFGQEHPRLDEVKEAFDVFNENRDGYIDAKELNRLFFFALGLN